MNPRNLHAGCSASSILASIHKSLNGPRSFHMNSQRMLITAVVLLLLVGTTGCITGITWLPDSSGFIYMKGDSNDRPELVHFDLVTKKQRTIVTDEKIKDWCWPAISPDGKSVAVARLLGHDKDKGHTLQILLHDLNGKTKKQSKVFSIPERGYPSVFWGPSEDKIVVSIFADQFKMVGIYDVKNDELKVLKDATACVFAGRLTRPDGKGFVVTKWKGKSCLGLSFIDSDGKERPIAMNPPIENYQDKEGMLQVPYFFTSSWDGAKALISTSKDRCEIDTDKLLCKFDSFASGEPRGENFVRQQFPFARSQIVLRVLDCGGDHKCRLGILDAHQKKTQTLMEYGTRMVLFPSPNGKLAAACWELDKRNPTDMIWVIDKSGKVVAKVEVRLPDE